MKQAQTATVEDGCVSCTVVEAVADVKGVPSMSLTPPLYEVIDPDTLDQLFGDRSLGGQLNGRVTFNYNGCEVIVRGGDTVSVEVREQ
jgi:hypothetical protein